MGCPYQRSGDCGPGRGCRCCLHWLGWRPLRVRRRHRQRALAREYGSRVVRCRGCQRQRLRRVRRWHHPRVQPERCGNGSATAEQIRAASKPPSSPKRGRVMTRTAHEWPELFDSVECALPPAPNGFLSAYPGYQTTVLLDRLRTTEYSYLDASGHVYLDYTGAGLPAQSQLAAHAERIRGHCFGNPHSENPTSAASTELIERARLAILAHFNAPPEEYAVIFTPNATGACRLVGEGYPFGPRTRLVLTADNHNSVNGIREFARSRGAVTQYVPFCSPELRVDEDAMHRALARSRPGLLRAAWRVARRGTGPWMGRRGLLAYPAQSNFSGVQHPL